MKLLLNVFLPIIFSRCFSAGPGMASLKWHLKRKRWVSPASIALPLQSLPDEDSLSISETNRVISMKLCIYDELLTVVRHKINEVIIKCISANNIQINIKALQGCTGVFSAAWRLAPLRTHYHHSFLSISRKKLAGFNEILIRGCWYINGSPRNIWSWPLLYFSHKNKKNFVMPYLTFFYMRNKLQL